MCKKEKSKTNKWRNGQPFRCDDGLVVMFMFIQDDLVIFEVGQ